MYDILWDDIFNRFYIDDKPEFPDYTDAELEAMDLAELEAMEEGADCWLLDTAGIL